MIEFLPEHSEIIEVRPSPLDGLGVFAKVPFKKGEVILSGLGEGMTQDAKPFGKDFKYLCEFRSRFSSEKHTKKRYIPSNETRYLNNCFKNPNVFFENSLRLFAIQDISEGDELLINYVHIGYHDWLLGNKILAKNFELVII